MLSRWGALACGLAIVATSCGSSSTRPGVVGTAGTQGAAGGAGAQGATGGAGAQGAPGGAGAAGVAGASGSTGGAPDAGGAGTGPSGGGSGGGGASGAVAPGTCGIARRISLPQLPAIGVDFGVRTFVWQQPDYVVRRVAGGFAFGPWSETNETGARQFRWVHIDPDGETKTTYATGWGTQGFGLAFFSMATPNRLVGVQSTGSAFWTGLVDDGATQATFVAKLADGEYTKFDGLSGTVSLDGQRGLFSLETTGEHPPWLAMYASDGTRVGDLLETTAAGDCDSVFATEHGAAFSRREGATLHVIGFSADGTVDMDLKIPAPGECPNLVLTDAGFAYLTYDVTDDFIGWTLHRLSRDGTTTLERWDGLWGCRSNTLALAVSGETAIATCAKTNETLIVKRSNGRDLGFPLERIGLQVRSEPGTLFLLDVNSAAVVPREIVEIRCAVD